MNEEDAKRLNAELKAMPEDDRLALLEIIFDDICRRCGDVLHGDRCWSCYDSPSGDVG